MARCSSAARSRSTSRFRTTRRTPSTRKSARVIDLNYKRAKDILETNLDKLHVMADALIKYETIDETQIKDIMTGKPPKPPADWEIGRQPRRRSGPKASAGRRADRLDPAGPA